MGLREQPCVSIPFQRDSQSRVVVHRLEAHAYPDGEGFPRKGPWAPVLTEGNMVNLQEAFAGLWKEKCRLAGSGDSLWSSAWSCSEPGHAAGPSSC